MRASGEYLRAPVNSPVGILIAEELRDVVEIVSSMIKSQLGSYWISREKIMTSGLKNEPWTVH
jgi:hypothetical protein